MNHESFFGYTVLDIEIAHKTSAAMVIGTHFPRSEPEGLKYLKHILWLSGWTEKIDSPNAYLMDKDVFFGVIPWEKTKQNKYFNFSPYSF